MSFFEGLLDSPPDRPSWPPGMNVRLFRPRLDERLVYELHMETYADRARAFEREPFDRWCERHLGSSFDPSLWFIAEVDDEPAGICLCNATWSADGSLAWISVLGVHRRWRQRGLGLALVLHVFGDLYRRGFLSVGLSLHGENPRAHYISSGEKG